MKDNGSLNSRFAYPHQPIQKRLPGELPESGKCRSMQWNSRPEGSAENRIQPTSDEPAQQSIHFIQNRCPGELS